MRGRRRIDNTTGVMRQVVISVRLRELLVARLPGVIKIEIALYMVGELQTLQCADRDLRRELDLVFVIEYLLQERLESLAYLQALQFHLLTSLV